MNPEDAAAALPTEMSACSCVGCWNVVVHEGKMFCNTHRVQRQNKYKTNHPGHSEAPVLSGDKYELKQEARRTSDTVQAYVDWVEEHGAVS